MRFLEGAIKFSPKEAECLVQQYDQLRQYTYFDLDELDAIRKKLATSRIVSMSEWEKYMKWRRPKGTIMSRPCYFRILTLYYKKRKCSECKGSGHDYRGEVCKVCSGAGVNPKVKGLLGK